MALTDKEQKLLRLALDQGARPGEVATAAAKLIESWRTRGLAAEELGGGGGGTAAEPWKPFAHRPKVWQPDYGLCTMPWGKYRDQQFKDIPPDYLAYQLGWMRSEPSRAAKLAKLANEIERFLAQ
jgi:hypothetical protein